MSWENPEADLQESSLPDWQRRLLDERMAEEDADPEAGSSWEEVKQRILDAL